MLRRIYPEYDNTKYCAIFAQKIQKKLGANDSQQTKLLRGPREFSQNSLTEEKNF